MFSHHSSIFFPKCQSVMSFSQFNTRPGSNFKVNLLPKHLLCAMAIRQNSGKLWSFSSTLRVIQTSKHLLQDIKTKGLGKIKHSIFHSMENLTFYVAFFCNLMRYERPPNPKLSQKNKSSFVKPSH